MVFLSYWGETSSILEVAHKELRLPRLLATHRRFDLILVDELGYLPFAKPTPEGDHLS